MPVISSNYKPSLLFRNGHIATIYSGLVREVENPGQQRERMELDDGDFIDLDWSLAHPANDTVVIILHGLEGNAQRPYILGAARAFLEVNIDVCAVNFRGCSGEPNRLYRSYHSGVTDDLERIVHHILDTRKYHKIIIHGFSLGGNVTLKYLGSHEHIPSQVKAGIAVSAPCSLFHSMLALHETENFLYALRFKKHLLGKLRQKQPLYPELIKEEDFDKVKLLRDFDDVYTAKAHGFIDGLDYYERASSLPYLENIKVPTYILNAENDSFLTEGCYPYEAAGLNENLFLEIPEYGGHVGFIDKNNRYYNEQRAVKFVLEKVMSLPED